MLSGHRECWGLIFNFFNWGLILIISINIFMQPLEVDVTWRGPKRRNIIAIVSYTIIRSISFWLIANRNDLHKYEFGFIIMEDIMPLFWRFFQLVSVLVNMHALFELYKNSYPTSCSFLINVFILNMIYKLQVSN